VQACTNCKLKLKVSSANNDDGVVIMSAIVHVLWKFVCISFGNVTELRQCPDLLPVSAAADFSSIIKSALFSVIDTSHLITKRQLTMCQ